MVGVTVKVAVAPEQTVWLLTVAAVRELTLNVPAEEVNAEHPAGVTTHSYWLLSEVPVGAMV